MASYKDYIPEGQAEFNNWQRVFMEELHQGAAGWEIAEAVIEPLDTLQQEYIALYAVANLVLRYSRTGVQVAKLANSRKRYEAALRSFVQRYVRANPLIDSSGRTALGVTVPDTIRTKRGTPGTAPEISTMPLKGAGVKIFVRQQAGAEGTSRRAKPKDVSRIEVAVYVGAEAPAEADEWADKRQYGRTNIIHFFQAADSGKMAWIACRFIGFNHMPGSWSRIKKEIVTM